MFICCFFKKSCISSHFLLKISIIVYSTCFIWYDVLIFKFLADNAGLTFHWLRYLKAKLIQLLIGLLASNKWPHWLTKLLSCKLTYLIGQLRRCTR